jgi:zinc protease
VLLAFAEVRMDGDLDSATHAMIEMFETVADQPMTEEEVERAKTRLLKNIELGFNASDRIGMQLSEWSSMGDWRLIFLHRDRIRDVTVEDVQAVATTYLKPANRTIGRFIPSQEPDRAEIPELLDVAVMVAGYEGMKDLAEGEAFDPSVANIESRTTRTTFANGFQVALLPKKTRGESVVARGTIHFGSESALLNQATAAEYAGGMLLRGTATKTRQEVKDEFDRLKAQVRVSGTVSSATFSVETNRENLTDVLLLLGEVLHEPVFDEAEFAELMEERLAGLESQKSEPVQQGIRAFRRHLSPHPKGHPSYIPTFDEEVVNLSTASVAEVRTFYASFYGVGAGELAVVGDFDPEEILPVLQGIFAQWESPQDYQRIANPYQSVEPINLTLETPDKANAVFLVGKNVPISDTDDDYPALVLANYMLGGGFLNSRLATRIRQEEGLSYGVGSQFVAASKDENGTFIGFAIYAPENLEALEIAFIEEIEKALADGFTAEEIEAAKTGYLEGRDVSRAQDRELAGGLSGALYDGRTLEHDAEVESAIADLSSEAIVAAMRRRLDPSSMSIIKAGDFAGSQEEMEATP